jgi:hypothetical protein
VLGDLGRGRCKRAAGSCIPGASSDPTPSPRATASLRNLAIGILHVHGYRNIAAALRRNARDATRSCRCQGITSQ